MFLILGSNNSQESLPEPCATVVAWDDLKWPGAHTLHRSWMLTCWPSRQHEANSVRQSLHFLNNNARQTTLPMWDEITLHRQSFVDSQTLPEYAHLFFFLPQPPCCRIPPFAPTTPVLIDILSAFLTQPRSSRCTCQPESSTLRHISPCEHTSRLSITWLSTLQVLHASPSLASGTRISMSPGLTGPAPTPVLSST